MQTKDEWINWQTVKNLEFHYITNNNNNSEWMMLIIMNNMENDPDVNNIIFYK